MTKEMSVGILLVGRSELVYKVVGVDLGCLGRVKDVRSVVG